MIRVMEEIYARLTGDNALVASLATYQGAPAVFIDWAQQVTGPYLVLTYLPANEQFDAQVQQPLQIDIFERRPGQMASYATCLAIRNAVVRLMDRFNALDGVENLRVYYDSEQPVPDDDGRYRRYMVTFTLRWNRTADLQA